MTATPLPDGPLLAWYGDDFTGAAAVMEVMTFAGLPAVLFFDIPTAEQRAAFAGYRGFGIAGIARSQTPDWMDANLPRIYGALASFGAPLVQYKVCSTFDSAPTVGSIGRATELGAAAFGGVWYPLLVAAPAMGRYQAFGNLFAVEHGVVYRIDRHPTMSRHPVTPMDEADVRRHLARQTDMPIGLVDVAALEDGHGAAALTAARDAGAAIIALDAMDEISVAAAGELIWEYRADRQFMIGSQGIQYALVAYWRAAGLIDPVPPPALADPVDRLPIVSGSCSPVTAGQIAWAAEHGFEPLRIDPSLAVDEAAWRSEVERAIASALDAIGRGKSPIVFSAEGPDDPVTPTYRAAVEQSGQPIEAINQRVGAGLGAVLGQVLRDSGLSRGVIAGGDTSSHGASTLGIYALTAMAPAATGGALCRAHSDDPDLAEFEIALKGGQMGAPDYFAQVRNGGATVETEGVRE
ncbi:four-carbon acid sugar kinase family protein [Bauldia sp.]|uniref:four-carbon acid sugar kinase family protein n=1 Tax=Bauldia sp. TaxID=2575872 RepID=UPI003BAC7E7A